MVGGPRWVSQWATLAASHIRTDPEGSGGESHVMVTEDRGKKKKLLLNRKNKVFICKQKIIRPHFFFQKLQRGVKLQKD